MKNKEEIQRYLAVIKRATRLIEDLLEENDVGVEELISSLDSPRPSKLETVEMPVAIENIAVEQAEPQTAEEMIQEKTPPIQPPNEWKKLREKHIHDLMAIECWPEAVPPFLLGETTHKDQEDRARDVLNMVLDRNVEGLNLIDFGCGEGWITKEAKNRGVKLALGYDVTTSDLWTQNPNGAEFTADFGLVPKEFFDIAILYDVLDHCFQPLELMAQVRASLKPNGLVYIRCHPWTARHATHLYKLGINKAYLHLFLTWVEIRETLLDCKHDPIFTRVETDPLTAYHYWFTDSGFEIKKERKVIEPVNDFFFVPSFKELIANEQKIPMSDIDAFVERMQIQFVDYVLKPV